MKTIIVTGTSTGIGFAAAVALARAGDDVIGTMRGTVARIAGARGEGEPVAHDRPS